MKSLALYLSLLSISNGITPVDDLEPKTFYEYQFEYQKDKDVFTNDFTTEQVKTKLESNLNSNLTTNSEIDDYDLVFSNLEHSDSSLTLSNSENDIKQNENNETEESEDIEIHFEENVKEIIDEQDSTETLIKFDEEKSEFIFNIEEVTIDNFEEQINFIEQSSVSSYEKTIQIEQICDKILKYYDGSLIGKKITCIGDSITYGNGGSTDENGNKISYCNHIAGFLGANVVNLGIGGSAISDNTDNNSLISRWQEIPEDSDYILIFAGINDYFIGNYGNIDDKTENTFCGDTYSLLKNIKNKYSNSKIIVVLTYKNEAMNWEDFKDNDFMLYMNTLKQYAKELELPVIDLSNSEFMNSNDSQIKESYIPDGVHPNDTGNYLLSKRLCIFFVI